MLHSQSSRLGSILLLIAAVIGFGVALWAWLTPLTGVTGTIGALGVAIASVVLALLTLLLRGSTGGARVFWIVVTLAVLFGIGFSAALLHQYIITAAMVVGLIGLIALGKQTGHHAQRVRV